MGIKSDTWIRRMAQEHGMITPFEEKQVSQGIISYGVSSYGYDLRVSDTFKIFTNINHTVVDPKNFDAQSFIDFKGPICTVPPNSFALACSVEYFKIPTNVISICLGKCLTGDTRVVDAETGAYLPIQEFAGRKKTVSLNRWKMNTSTVSDFIPQGKKPVFELRTKTGLKIRATANHPFRQFHGWTPLSELKPGARIAVARNMPIFGKTPLPDWEAALLGLMISEGQCHTPGHSPTFTTADPVLVELLKQCISQGNLGTVTYKGRYGYRLVNRQGQGGIAECNKASTWLKSYKLNVTAEHKFVPQAVFTAPKHSVRRFLQALFAGDGGLYCTGQSCHLEYYSNSQRLIDDVHHLLLRFGIVSLIREKQTQVGTTAYRIQITDHTQIQRFNREIGFWPGSVKQVRLESEIVPFIQRQTRSQRSNFDTLPPVAWNMLRHTADTNNRSLLSLGIKSSQPVQSMPYTVATQVAQATQDPELLELLNGPVWDVVTDIQPVGMEDVYDLTVPGHHNFVANDMIVHNSTYARCGIIVNVTPFEPGWEGYVTLEISNTTPLPCRVYANEGLCQVLFFEGDEPCETSYSDRQGKYQGQHGIVLPKINPSLG